MIPGFLENRRRDLEKLASALERDDYESVRYRGHNMKGCGTGYGFTEITRIGSIIEQAAKNSDKQGIAEQTAALSDYLSRVEVI